MLLLLVSGRLLLLHLLRVPELLLFGGRPVSFYAAVVPDYLSHHYLISSHLGQRRLRSSLARLLISPVTSCRPSIFESLHFHVNHHISSAIHLCICLSLDLFSVASPAHHRIHTSKVTIRVLSYLVSPRPLSHFTSVPLLFLRSSPDST